MSAHMIDLEGVPLGPKMTLVLESVGDRAREAITDRLLDFNYSAELLADNLSYMDFEVSPSTIRGYRRALRRHRERAGV